MIEFKISFQSHFSQREERERVKELKALYRKVLKVNFVTKFLNQIFFNEKKVKSDSH